MSLGHSHVQTVCVLFHMFLFMSLGYNKYDADLKEYWVDYRTSGIKGSRQSDALTTSIQGEGTASSADVHGAMNMDLPFGDVALLNHGPQHPKEASVVLLVMYVCMVESLEAGRLEEDHE